MLADSHVSARAPEANSNWASAVANSGNVGLVVHVGDLTLDGSHHKSDLEHARALLDALPVPWVAVPGNHDIGDNPGSSDGPLVDLDRLHRWRNCVGADHWAIEAGDWTVVGVNAQLFASDLDAEVEQWAWLEQRFSLQPSDRPVLLVTHKPIAAPDEELSAAPPYRFVPPPARARIDALLGSVWCPLVLSGHVHQFRTSDIGGRLHVWAPTTWAVLPEYVQPTVGLKRCGALSIELDRHGIARVELVDFDVAQLTLIEDVGFEC